MLKTKKLAGGLLIFLSLCSFGGGENYNMLLGNFKKKTKKHFDGLSPTSPETPPPRPP